MLEMDYDVISRNGELVANIQAFRTTSLMRSSDFIFEVQCIDTNTYMVDLSRHFCSCNYWHIQCFPCSYVVACISCTLSSFYDYCNMYFLASTFRLTHEQCEHRVLISHRPNEVSEVADVHPPGMKRLPGRPKKNRVHNKGGAR